MYMVVMRQKNEKKDNEYPLNDFVLYYKAPKITKILTYPVLTTIDNQPSIC